MPATRVLFLCTGNSARSLLAEALLRHLGGDKFEVNSAGTHPKGINPLTSRVLTAEGVPFAGARSKAVSEFEGQPFDYVITVCDQAAEECPIFPTGTTRLHWSLTDPAAVEGDEATKLAAFEATLEDLRVRISEFVTSASNRARMGAPGRSIR
jgi:arsenate reductase